MMLIKKSPHKNLILATIWISLITGCSTQIEERASIDFEPIMPSESKIAKKDKYGSIYSNSQQGLFATDRRASKIGDILTVALSENFSASKSQSAKSAKKGATKFDFPNIDQNLYCHNQFFFHTGKLLQQVHCPQPAV